MLSTGLEIKITLFGPSSLIIPSPLNNFRFCMFADCRLFNCLVLLLMFACRSTIMFRNVIGTVVRFTGEIPKCQGRFYSSKVLSVGGAPIDPDDPDDSVGKDKKCNQLCIMLSNQQLCNTFFPFFFLFFFFTEFFEMVKLFYDKAAAKLEPHLIDTMKGRISREEKEKKVKGIMKVVKPCKRSDIIYYLSIENIKSFKMQNLLTIFPKVFKY